MSPSHSSTFAFGSSVDTPMWMPRPHRSVPLLPVFVCIFISIRLFFRWPIFFWTSDLPMGWCWRCLRGFFFISINSFSFWWFIVLKVFLRSLSLFVIACSCVILLRRCVKRMSCIRLINLLMASQVDPPASGVFFQRSLRLWRCCNLIKVLPVYLHFFTKFWVFVMKANQFRVFLYNSK